MVPEADAGRTGVAPHDLSASSVGVQSKIGNGTPPCTADGAAARTLPWWGGPLSESDYATLDSSWISREVADEAMLRRVDEYEGRKVVC